MKKCNVNFESKYAILDGRQMTIEDYLKNKTRLSGKLYCIPGNHELISVDSVQRRPHFRHKHSYDIEGHPMTQWHSEWQSNFPDTEIEFKHKANQLRDRRADIVLPKFKQIVEIQHSKIESGEVNSRMKDYNLHDHNVKWIIDGQNSINVKKQDKRLILEFSTNYWLFQSFLGCNNIYYDIEGFIYQINPNNVKSYQVDVSEPKLKSEFIDSLKNNTNLWVEDEPPQCFLHVKQQGAGSGKTFGMMQLLNSDPEITHYKYIALITKQHSAVKVMVTEFDDQYYGTGSHKEKKLTNMEDLESSMSDSGKQYIRKYRNTLTNTVCIAIFGTVDSFTYALGDSPNNAADKFNGIVQSIRDGTIKTNYMGKMKYASVNPILNKEMLIMVDETQDLTEIYGEALLQVVRSKCTNLCVVGDRLQSLSFKDNTLTYLHRAEDAMMKVIKADTTNVVRRFSDPALVKFVNDLIPFQKYGLPPMRPEEIRTATPNALTVFSAKTVCADKSEDSEEVINAVEQIINLVKEEALANDRIPEDFLIVTPFTKKNPLVEALQIALNSFWKDLMENDTTYIENVKNNNNYWKDVDTSKFRRYAIFHKSEDGCSINTNESINATRMLSIHSSKGDGRKVVFVIGVTESALQLFSQVSNNLIYDSLLHVAITRQKEKLYFRLEQNGDDINTKIENSDTDLVTLNTSFDIQKKSVKIPKIVGILQKTSFEHFYTNLISPYEIAPLPQQTTDKKLIIDMGEHNMRHSAMFMNIIVHACNHEFIMRLDTKKQFFAILNGVKDAIIKPVADWKGYYKILKNNKDKKLDAKSIKYIPVIKVSSKDHKQEYEIYYKIIIETINRVKEELGCLGKTTLDYFCPLESVVLFYMIESTQKGKYQAITISDLYNIIDIYSKVYDSSAKGHNTCGCNKHFPINNNTLTKSEQEYKEYLCNHYDRLSHVNSLLDEFDIKHKNINWLYNHTINIKNSSSFDIKAQPDMIGYNNECVFNLYIKPQFNELNYNEFLVSSLFQTYLLCNLEETSENYKKFANKPVISYVISFNKDVIYEVNWTNIIEDKKEFIKKVIYDIMFNMYSVKHTQYHSVFKNIITTMKEQNPQQILKKCESSFEYDTTPKYLCKAWNSISDKLEDCEGKKEQRRVLSKYTDADTFVGLFHHKLNISLKSFLEIHEEDDESD